MTTANKTATAEDVIVTSAATLPASAARAIQYASDTQTWIGAVAQIKTAYTARTLPLHAARVRVRMETQKIEIDAGAVQIQIDVTAAPAAVDYLAQLWRREMESPEFWQSAADLREEADAAFIATRREEDRRLDAAGAAAAQRRQDTQALATALIFQRPAAWPARPARRRR